MNYAASIIGHGRYQDGPVEVNGVSRPTQGWLDDVSADFAIEWMQQNRDHRFLMVVGFKRPHRLGDVPTLYAVRTTTRKRSARTGRRFPQSCGETPSASPTTPRTRAC